MGFCYDMQGRLACDICGESGGVRKVNCPAKWCQAVAQCKACRDSGRLLRESPNYHAHCAANSAKHEARDVRAAALRASGAAVRCSALQRGDKVHVLFSRALGPDLGFYMAPETYDAIPLLEPATAEDFRRYGALEPAPGHY